MKTEHKQILNDNLKQRLGRDPKPNEKINDEKDPIALIQLLTKRVDDLEDLIKK